MSFRIFKLTFHEEKWGGVVFKSTDVLLINGSAHYGQIIKVGDNYSKTEYTHVYPNTDLLKHIYEVTIPIPRKQLIKLRHHFTRRIWMLDGVFECINWQELNKEPLPPKCKLLPPEMCYSCLLEGNKYIPKQLGKGKWGTCRCCGNLKTKLFRTRLGWPCDLRHKGFGFTIIGEGVNYINNIQYYNSHFDMSIFKDYTG